MPITSIAAPIFMEILDESTNKIYYGCNQEWYATEWQRFSGCAPSAVATIMLYLNHTKSILGSEKNFNNKKNCLSLMEEIWLSPLKKC